MKTRFWASFVIFMSAYAPLAFLFAIRDWDDGVGRLKHPSFVWCALLAAGFSLLLLKVVVASFQGDYHVVPTAVEYRSNDLVEYTIPYLISFFSVDFGKWPDIAALGFFLFLLFILSFKTQTLFINPVLALLGYGMYDVEFEEGGRTRKVIFLAKNGITAKEPCRVDRIAEFLFIVVSRTEHHE